MIHLENISFGYPGGRELIHNRSFSFSIHGSYALLGPSGCGKTTLLKLIAGLIEPSKGHVYAPDNVSFLFQEPRLIPQRTLYQNLELPIKVFWEKTKRKEKIQCILSELELSGYEGFYPAQLSGGMQQRASMGRAFLYPSDLLLMDEPFKGQDPLLRLKLMELLKTQLLHHRRTLIAVTHQIDEALYLADEISLLSMKNLEEEQRWVNPLKDNQRQLDAPELIKMEKDILKRMMYYTN